MRPAITAVRMTGSAQRAELPLLVLGPSLGTSAVTLWSAAARDLAAHFDVLAWDLPGHGYNRSVPEEPFTMAELAAGVLTVVDEIRPGEVFDYAGDSVGGCVGLQLLLDAPDRVDTAVLLCTGARIGDESTWADRVAQVRASGTPVLVGASAERWFAPGFADRDPETVSSLLHALQDADDLGYVRVCEALASFDVRDRLGDIGSPVLAVAGADDPVTTTEHLTAIATGVRRGALVELADTSHLAPAERPAEVAALIRRHALGTEPDMTPGLDPRSRSIVTLTALIARGHHEELAMHLRAALRNGLTVDEIKEVILQSASYGGVPDAEAAFRIAQQVVEEAPAEQ